jgi:HNH endonuclease
MPNQHSLACEWTKEGVLHAIQRWNKQYGEGPFQSDWEKTTADHPSKWLVRKHWGSWSQGVEAAGLVPRSKGGVSHKFYVWERITPFPGGDYSYVFRGNR